MTAIQYKTYPSMPEYGHRFRPEGWAMDEDYNEVFQTLNSGSWFAVMVSTTGGQQRTSAKDSKEDAEAAIYEHIAFTRKFWDQKVAWMNNGDLTIPDHPKEPVQRVARIGGHHYVIGPTPSARQLEENRQFGGLGHGGREFVIKFHNGDEVTTRNLWAQGKIDPEYRDVLTDNAEFLSGS